MEMRKAAPAVEADKEGAGGGKGAMQELSLH